MRKVRNLASILLGATALAVLAPSALASTQPAAGSFVETPYTITSERFAGGNEFYHLTREAIFSGTYTGVGQVDQDIVVHSDGSINIHQTIEFSGLACGQPVELVFRIQATGSFVTNEIHGSWTTVGPTPVGRGNGTFDSVPDVGGAYVGHVDCV